MTVYYLDASAWVKRHVQELGSDWVRRFWRKRPRLACSSIGSLEVLAAILRRSQAANSGTDSVTSEVTADAQGLYEVSVSPAVMSKAQQLICRHRLRCADAIHLASAFVIGEELGESVCVIASDVELLAAAVAEGFAAVDPQADPPMPEIH